MGHGGCAGPDDLIGVHRHGGGSAERHGLALAALFESHIRLFLAWADGVPVGCGGVALDDGYAEIKQMFVREAWRGQGIAQALLARLREVAAEAGRTVLRLETGRVSAGGDPAL
jgi:GNAT superfamily N-acetyltransferase